MPVSEYVFTAPQCVSLSGRHCILWLTNISARGMEPQACRGLYIPAQFEPHDRPHFAGMLHRHTACTVLLHVVLEYSLCLPFLSFTTMTCSLSFSRVFVLSSLRLCVRTRAFLNGVLPYPVGCQSMWQFYFTTGE